MTKSSFVGPVLVGYNKRVLDKNSPLNELNWKGQSKMRRTDPVSKQHKKGNATMQLKSSTLQTFITIWEGKPVVMRRYLLGGSGEMILMETREYETFDDAFANMEVWAQGTRWKLVDVQTTADRHYFRFTTEPSNA